jgi:hypothetical protein
MYKNKHKATQNHDKCEGRIRCHGGASRTTTNVKVVGSGVMDEEASSTDCAHPPCQNYICTGLTVVKSQYGNDSLTKDMKQIIIGYRLYGKIW